MLLLLFGAISALGQQYIYEFQQLKDELTEPRYNWYIHQDQHNMVWLSSTAGLNRYDGEEIKQYRPNRANPNALRSVYASQSHFFDDDRDNVWFTEDEAVIRYDYEQDHFDRFYAQNIQGDTLYTGYSWAHLDTLSGQFWFQVDDQLYTCDTRSSQAVVVARGDAPNLQRKTLWRSTDGQLFLFAAAKDSLLIRRYSNNFLITQDTLLRTTDGAEIQQIAPQSEHLSWIATTEGLATINLTSLTWQAHPGTWAGKAVRGLNNLAIIAPHQLLVGTSKEGIYVYDAKQRLYSGKLRQLIDGILTDFTPQISTFRLDQDRNLWISTLDEGVLFTNLQKPKFKILLPNRSVLALAEDAHGQVLAVTDSYLYTLKNEEIIDSLPLPSKGRDFENARFVHEDTQGNIWIGTESCLFIKPSMARALIPFQQLPKEVRETQTYTAIGVLPNNRLVFGNSQDLPFGLTADLEQSFFIPGAAESTTFVAGLGSFLFTYSANNEFRIYQTAGEILKLDTLLSPLPIVNSIVASSQPNHFLLATDDGLFQLQRNERKQWQLLPDKKLGEKAMNSLLFDTNHQYWIGSPQGLMQYDPTSGTQHFFQKSDGLSSRYFNRATALAHSDGQYYFGNSAGLTVFLPDALRSRIPPPRPAITRIRVNQEEANLRPYNPANGNNPFLIQTLKVPFDKNSLSLHLAGREYSGKCRYIYQLKSDSGTKTDTLINTNVLQFSNLREGRYELCIQALNADNQASLERHQLIIIVWPPWYRSWWFLLCCSLLTLLVFHRIYRYRLRIITETKNAELAKAAAELKAAEALQKVTMAEQQKAETETAVLRLQMNPHFIFNGLNTIDALILKKAPGKAHDILIQFARLMRRILDNSEEQLVSIAEEVSFLEEYLRLESNRFPGRMTYAFHVDPRIDQEDTDVPTMILQPFVENAIIHGLGPKKGTGHIQINFLLDDAQQLICEVIDNGVGRQYKTTTQEHISKATMITRRRLTVLAGTYKLDPPPRLHLIDHADEEGLATGTTVQLFFPIWD